jgi:Caspase domain
VNWLLRLPLASLGLLCIAPTSAIAQPAVHTYALLVGSNPGGEGQAQLHFAHDDAERMAQVLIELGHYAGEQTRILRSPNRDAVLAALDQLANQLRSDAERGEQTQFLFYYSGHARSNALQLGADELLLPELRERILQLPSTFKLVVLDACQSGAFSSVKGATPAAAFSYNSVARLRTSGVAVMASSSASELSQESEALRGSFFTHHLTVGLRGAGDRDRDGIVSLAEAYAYAYDHTLSSTARTAVGRQHVTLETALTGQGEVPLTYPARASAQLELPAGLDADVVIERRSSVIAELHKAPGNSVTLALSPGLYTALLRRAGTLAECSVPLAEAHVTPLALSSCQLLSADEARAKGRSFLGAPPSAARAGTARETWSLVFAVGGSTRSRHDDYVQRLDDFGFERDLAAIGTPSWQLGIGYALAEHLSVGIDLRNLDTGSRSRPTYAPGKSEDYTRFEWSSYAFTAQLQAHADPFSALRLFVQLGVGAGLAESTLRDDSQVQLGPVFNASAGLYLMPWRTTGFVLQAMYAYAPLLANELDETHDSGGLIITAGLRFRLWSTP